MVFSMKEIREGEKEGRKRKREKRREKGREEGMQDKLYQSTMTWKKSCFEKRYHSCDIFLMNQLITTPDNKKAPNFCAL